jgi:hypothetical protein
MDLSIVVRAKKVVHRTQHVCTNDGQQVGNVTFPPEHIHCEHPKEGADSSCVTQPVRMKRKLSKELKDSISVASCALL